MHNKLDSIIKLEERIIGLQKSFVLSQEELRNFKTSTAQNNVDSILRVIDILDLIELILIRENIEDNSNFRVVIKKIEKRLRDLLKYWQVKEIIFTNNQIEPGKVRVLDTRTAFMGVLPGTIIEICRKGYQQGERVIRPADVITAQSN